MLAKIEQLKRCPLYSGRFDLASGKYDELENNFQEGYVPNYEDLENARKEFVEYSQALGKLTRRNVKNQN